MSNKYLGNKFGLTLIELLLVIGIMAIFSIFFVVNVKVSNQTKLRNYTESLLSDIRLARNLAASRAFYRGSFPGGYGLAFHNGLGNGPSYYRVFAGNPNFPENIIKTVTFSHNYFRVYDVNGPSVQDFRFKYLPDNNIETSSMTLSNYVDQKYEVGIKYQTKVSGVDSTSYIKGQIVLAEKTSDGFSFANLGISYGAEGVCSNGKVEYGEQCDDGNTINEDACTNACRFNICGDGVRWPSGGQECDTSLPNPCDDQAVDYWCFSCRRTEVNCPLLPDGQEKTGSCNQGCVYKNANCPAMLPCTSG